MLAVLVFGVQLVQFWQQKHVFRRLQAYAQVMCAMFSADV